MIFSIVDDDLFTYIVGTLMGMFSLTECGKYQCNIVYAHSLYLFTAPEEKKQQTKKEKMKERRDRWLNSEYYHNVT
jgi:hypothetical protein